PRLGRAGPSAAMVIHYSARWSRTIRGWWTGPRRRASEWTREAAAPADGPGRRDAHAGERLRGPRAAPARPRPGGHHDRRSDDPSRSALRHARQLHRRCPLSGRALSPRPRCRRAPRPGETPAASGRLRVARVGLLPAAGRAGALLGAGARRALRGAAAAGERTATGGIEAQSRRGRG